MGRRLQALLLFLRFPVPKSTAAVNYIYVNTMAVASDGTWPVQKDAWPDDVPELGGIWTNNFGHGPTLKTGMLPTGSI